MNTKNEVIISRSEFISLTNELNPKVTFSNLFQITKPRMNKGGRQGLNTYYDRVMKYTRTRVLVGMEYEKRRQKTDPDFKVSDNKVFDKHLNSFIGYNTKLNRYYLKYEWFDQVPPKSEFICEGNSIDKKLFEEWLVVSKGRELNYQVVDINNLQEITLDHTKYILVD
jgi:ASC-1-like (ASCH) protein